MTDSSPVPVSTLRRVVAAILDFFTIFIIGGIVVANLLGGRTEGGFDLTGFPALVLFALIVLYFVIGYRYAGGTLWQRILRVR